MIERLGIDRLVKPGIKNYAINLKTLIKNLNSGIFTIGLVKWLVEEIEDTTKNVVVTTSNSWLDTTFSILKISGKEDVIGIEVKHFYPDMDCKQFFYVHKPAFELYDMDKIRIHPFQICTDENLNKLQPFDYAVYKKDNLIEVNVINNYWVVGRLAYDLSESEKRMVKLKQIVQ